MSEWRQRLTQKLEPVLRETDPRTELSAYHDMPYAVFHYPPNDEFALRGEVAMLRTRLEQGGKRVTVVSLAICVEMALKREGLTPDDIKMVEAKTDTALMADTVHNVLSKDQPLDALVAEQLPEEPDPLVDVVFITRVGALFPLYRISALLDQIHGKVVVPAVLFYPGDLEGSGGLRFMGVMGAEHNYRPKIF